MRIRTTAALLTLLPSLALAAGNPDPLAQESCLKCGTVQHVEHVLAARPSGLGPTAGTMLGGHVHKPSHYTLDVLMDDGRNLVVSQDELDGVHEGARVVLKDDGVKLR
jgi:outer membrane lipoprotein SlyB